MIDNLYCFGSDNLQTIFQIHQQEFSLMIIILTLNTKEKLSNVKKILFPVVVEVVVVVVVVVEGLP